MDKQQLQQGLPEGLKLEKELVGAVVFGSAFEATDKRFNEATPIRRVVHFLEMDGNEAWQDSWKPQLIERIRRLTEAPLHRAARPLEVGKISDGSILYIVDDRYSSKLSAHVSREGMDSDIAARLFGQIVDGLVALHAREIVHGDIRLKNICIDEAVAGLETNCQIGNSAIGPLLYWSSGTVVDDDAPSYFPPEWKGCPQKPSTKADLYALGLIGIELFLGQGAVREGFQSKDGESPLQDHLKQGSVPSRTRRVLGSLLDPDPNKRPKTAAEVRNGLDHDPSQRWKSWGIVASMLVMLGLTFSGWLKVREAQYEIVEFQTTIESLNETVDNRDDELHETQRNLETAKQKVDSTKQKVATLESDNKRLNANKAAFTAEREQISQVLDTSETDSKKVEDIRLILRGSEPQLIWIELVKNVTSNSKPSQTPEGVIEGLKNRIDDIGKKKSLPSEDMSQLMEWHKQIDATWQDINPMGTDAYVKDNGVGTAWNNYLERPWVDPTQSALEMALAKAVWKHLCEPNKKPEEIVHAAEEQLAAPTTQGWLRPLLIRWCGPRSVAKKLTTTWKAKAWLDAKTDDTVVSKYRQLVRDAVHYPWDDATNAKALAELKALNEAAKIWEEYAKLSADSWSDFVKKTQAAARLKPNDVRVLGILADWQASFISHTGAWKLQLVKGTVKPPKGKKDVPDYGTGRLLTVYVNGDEAASLDHKWEKNFSHDYAKDKKGGLVKFNWNVGDSVGLFLEGERDFYIGGLRQDLIWDSTKSGSLVTFDGPVAIWRLHIQRRSSMPETGVSLDFRVVDCPGPPKDVYTNSLVDKAKNAATNSLK